MIYAALKDSAIYDSLGKRFRAGFEYLRRTDLKHVPIGTHQIEGDDVFAMVQENAVKPAEQCRWEAHKKYIDIQYIVAGTEGMGVGALDHFEVETPHDDTRDVAFYRPRPGAGATTIWVRPGEFALFFPTDVHKPLISPDGGTDKVWKVVVKVRV